MTDSTPLDTETLRALRRELFQLASREDEIAAAEAARVPYWAPTPPSVMGHRAAAAALREDAERLVAIASFAA